MIYTPNVAVFTPNNFESGFYTNSSWNKEIKLVLTKGLLMLSYRYWNDNLNIGVVCDCYAPVRPWHAVTMVTLGTPHCHRTWCNYGCLLCVVLRDSTLSLDMKPLPKEPDEDKKKKLKAPKGKTVIEFICWKQCYHIECNVKWTIQTM